ncbi:MAG: ABC transporter permease [Candidatus Babeliales bacterium]
MHSYMNTLWYLLLTDFKIFKRTIHDKIIDLAIWVATMVWVTAYLMPAFGLQLSYGAFMAASLFASAGLFEQFSSAISLVSDFEGNQTISYYLTLPIPSWLVFVRNMIFFSCNTAMLSFFVLPLSKLIAWHHIDLSGIQPLKLVLIFIFFNMFYAAFTVWLASMVSSMEKIGSIWMRFIYPLWFLGGFQYSLQVLYNYWPLLAYCTLLNPMIYVMEATRMAVLNQISLLNFWACLGMIFLFTIALGMHSIKRLKRRLDF